MSSLIEIEEYAWFQLEEDQSIDDARKEFLKKYPNDIEAFESMRRLLTENHGGL